MLLDSQKIEEHSQEWLYPDAAGTATAACSAYCQEFFVEAADFFGAVYEMDFQDPVALPAFGVFAAHFHGIVGVDVERDFIVRDAFVGKLAD